MSVLQSVCCSQCCSECVEVSVAVSVLQRDIDSAETRDVGAAECVAVRVLQCVLQSVCCSQRAAAFRSACCSLLHMLQKSWR